MNSNFIIDRIEGDFVVVEAEDEKMVNILKDNIVGSFKEGDVLEREGDFFKVNSELTKKRKEEIERMTKDMWK
ncbi:DUF3006 domain-containing protein [uncultured Clostridium sp.]|uniref:DUF3006 domain-containing protein n=1 Tax=uncultured Clostridium sp. TaxID=59620 RepID=UPI0025CE2C28|nr:DUF3006 domain-containing protein [uncultured Clostridium sp.]